MHSNRILWTPLGCAACSGHNKVIEQLLTAKADIESRDKLKSTPLHLAAREGHVAAVETLIKHHANVASRDQRNYNALDLSLIHI